MHGLDVKLRSKWPLTGNHDLEGYRDTTGNTGEDHFIPTAIAFTGIFDHQMSSILNVGLHFGFSFGVKSWGNSLRFEVTGKGSEPSKRGNKHQLRGVFRDFLPTSVHLVNGMINRTSYNWLIDVLECESSPHDTSKCNFSDWNVMESVLKSELGKY